MTRTMESMNGNLFAASATAELKRVCLLVEEVTSAMWPEMVKPSPASTALVLAGVNVATRVVPSYFVIRRSLGALASCVKAITAPL